jgi:hypothetical protein
MTGHQVQSDQHHSHGSCCRRHRTFRMWNFTEHEREAIEIALGTNRQAIQNRHALNELADVLYCDGDCFFGGL